MSTNQVAIAISGSGGLVGAAVAAAFADEGHRVLRLVRRTSGVGPDEVGWDPAAGRIDAAALAGARVLPGRLEQAGFDFRQREAESALRAILGGTRDGRSTY